MIMVETGIIILLVVGFMGTSMLTMRGLILLGTLMVFVVMLIKEIRKYS